MKNRFCLNTENQWIGLGITLFFFLIVSGCTASSRDTGSSSDALPQEGHGIRVYSPSECVGVVVQGICRGQIVPDTAIQKVCHGEMINGQCSGPVY